MNVAIKNVNTQRRASQDTDTVAGDSSVHVPNALTNNLNSAGHH